MQSQPFVRTRVTLPITATGLALPRLFVLPGLLLGGLVRH
jgi:hypothetical protein